MTHNGRIELLGISPVIEHLRAEIEQVARSDAKVLITGESGVGKEVVARAINAASHRANKPFVAVNCAGLPESLLESTLFGHVKGSFTGAYRDKPGKLEMADHGTIFMDEIGEMTLRMQGLLLRFLETGEIQKVGSERSARVTDVRVLTATNRRLSELISQNLFREDLYYRINVIHIEVPPLRERREDIPLLIEHFMRRFTTPAVNGHRPGNGNGNGNGTGVGAAAHEQRPPYTHEVKSISTGALDALTAYDWPGNVRQVENLVERLVVTGRREVVQVEDLTQEVRVRGAASPGLPKGSDQQAVADELFRKLIDERDSFWNVVYPLYMQREITKGHVRDLVHLGLEEARGNYKIVLRLFNMEPGDYKRFLNFLRKHDCQLPFKAYR